MKQNFKVDERGVSLIIVILIILIMGIIGAVLVSLSNNESFTAMDQSAGTLAFGVADGGVELEQYRLAQNVDWYGSTSDPMPSSIRVMGSSPNSGSFTVQTNLPATRLRRRIPNGATTANICVYTTNRFTPPASGYLLIGDVGLDPFEIVRYTGTGSSGGCAAEFTGISRNQTISGVSGGGGVAHERGELVYPITTLIDPLANNCNALATLRITDHPKLLTAGSLSILTSLPPNPVDWEQITYSSSSRAAGVMTLRGVKRCQDGTSSASQAAGKPITPILVDDPPDPPDYESEILSTGATALAVVGSVNRVIRKTVQR